MDIEFQTSWSENMSTLNKRVYSRNAYEDPIMTVYGGKTHGVNCSCDLCGEKMASDEILEIEDHVCLCHSCFNYFEGLLEGKIKEGIKEFLIGNVI